MTLTTDRAGNDAPSSGEGELSEIVWSIYKEGLEAGFNEAHNKTSKDAGQVKQQALAKLESWHAQQVEAAGKAKDSAYWERNQLVAALSKIFPAWLGYHEGLWEDCWRTIVYVIIPVHHEVSIGGMGVRDVGSHAQLSWHIHDDDKKYFHHLDLGLETWDGHTTEEKYKRLAQLATQQRKGEK